MNACLALAILLLTTDPAADASISGGPSPTAPDLRATLTKAQANFDQAVAMDRKSGPESRKLYREALAGFESVAKAGIRSPGLYYNMGNCAMRLGDVGRAIVNYRRALRLRPGDPNTRKNLDGARRLCEVQVTRPATDALAETLLFWHFGTSMGARTRVALAAYAGFWLAMLGLLRLRQRPAALKWLAGCVGAFSLAVGASVAWDHLVAANRPEGVVVAEQAVLRKGNGDYYDPQLTRPLSAGVEFRVLESREDVKGAEWHHVQLQDGKNGWVRADDTELI